VPPIIDPMVRVPARLLAANANIDDIDGFLADRNLPLDPDSRRNLAERIVVDPPRPGYITISNALQWRLQYGRAISVVEHNSVEGLEDLLVKF
jgi:hypothetical protein